VTVRRLTIIGLIVVVLAVAATAAVVIVYSRRSAQGVAKPAAAAPLPGTPLPGGRRIKARLFYVSEGGTRLTSIEQDVAFGETTVEQAKAIIAAQLAPVADPQVSAIPPGAALRALFVTAQGEAYVDFSLEFASAHPGGSTNELLTIYSVVNALTANLPVITSVQLLVNGKEVDTLAGHVDLRRPLTQNAALVE
jgi:hypothetical protein